MKAASILLVFAFAISTQAFAVGGYSGGGSDYHEIGTGTAWFIGTKEIPYCIQKSDNFGLSTTEIQQNFDSAVQTWTRYIQDRKIQTTLPREHQLNLNFRYVGACQGTELVRLYFGLEPKEVLEAKKKFEKPYAFAIRESYDLAAGMGKGFIWFAQTGSLFPKAGTTGFPNWTQPYTLHGMMLHELGHVLGVGHMDGTIMAESLMHWMQMGDSNESWATSRAKAVLTSIDDLKILYYGSNLEFKIDGQLSYNWQANEAKANFKTFMGREPVGEVRATYYNGQYKKLALTDSKGSTTFDIKTFEPLAKSFILQSNIFGVHYLDGNPTVLQVASQGLAGVGTITAKDGKSYTLHYSVNAYGLNGPVNMSFIDGQGSIRELFFSDIKGSLLK